MLTFHRQSGWTSPEVILRHHRGSLSIDESIVVAWADARDLAAAAAVSQSAFNGALEDVAPEFWDLLPESGRPVWRSIFLDLHVITAP